MTGTLDLTEFHDELRAVARSMLAAAGAGAAPSWDLVAGSGWIGLEAPEQFDGAGGGFAEVSIVLDEYGRAAAAGPLPSVAVLAVPVLGLVEPGPARDGLLSESVAGATVPVLVLGGGGLAAPPFRLDSTTGGHVLRGEAGFVLDAPVADRLLVPAAGPDGTVVLVDVDPGSVGIDVTNQPVLDATRSFGTVVANGAVIADDAVHSFRGDPARTLQHLYDRAATAVACDSLGLAEAMLDTTVAYVGMREQFGRRIGSFQAVKHACADMLVAITVSRRLVAGAVRALVDDAPDAAVAVSMAKSHVCAAAVDVAGKAVQLHGGMGYTWESGIHVYLKRATLNRSLFGSPGQHRRRLAERYVIAGQGRPGS